MTTTVANSGASVATGVTIHVDLPGSFRYRATTSIEASSAARSQPLDAAVNSAFPTWGVWAIPPKASVKITFTVVVNGKPGQYPITPWAAGDSAGSEVHGTPLTVVLEPAPSLQVNLAVNPSTVGAGGSVQYQVTVTNTGSASATGVAILVTLPEVMTYTSTGSVGGNSSRGTPIDPFKGAIMVFYGGWTVPAASDAGGPGTLVIPFQADCVAGAVAGSYPAAVHVTDDIADVVSQTNVASVAVTG